MPSATARITLLAREVEARDRVRGRRGEDHRQQVEIRPMPIELRSAAVNMPCLKMSL